MPEITETLYVACREEWRQWLMKNYQTAPEIWLIYPKKHTGRYRIPYNDAVEEALCFGWIDSITKGIDEDIYSQRFTPRNPKSDYSQTNIERLRWLIDQGQLMPEIEVAVVEVVNREFQWPPDIMAALQANSIAWENFQKYSDPYRRIRVAFVDTARNRTDEFEKRLRNLIKKSEQNKQFGFGIEDYY